MDKNLRTACIISGGIIACNIVRYISYKQRQKEIEATRDAIKRTTEMSSKWIEDMNLRIIESRKKAYLDQKAKENEAD